MLQQQDQQFVRVAIATFSGVPAEVAGDQPLIDALAALGAAVTRVAWDEEATDWSGFDLVLIRSTWNYTGHLERFLGWVDSLGQRVHNTPAIVRWNSDKRYLADLAALDLSVVPTVFLAPGEEPPPLTGDLVVKPTVSAGARDTGLFTPRTHGLARALIQHIHSTGRTAMVQPYQAAVATHGETAIVCFDGVPSHTLRKNPVLRPDEVAPVRDDELGAAEAMYDPGLVVVAQSSSAQLALVRQTLARITDRFGQPPLYCRVDMVDGRDGAPLVMELELIEPHLYLDRDPQAAERFASAALARTMGRPAAWVTTRPSSSRA